MKDFEEALKQMIIDSFIKVYGSKKWNELSNEAKDMFLHISVNATSETYDEVRKILIGGEK